MKDYIWEKIGPWIFIASVILFFLIVAVLYLPWQLFALAVKPIGHKVIRNRRDKLETPVVYYEHPITRRVVIVITSIHIGEAEYFAALQRFIDSLTGFQILFERIGRLTPAEEVSLTDEERGVYDYFIYSGLRTRKIAQIMSLVFQGDGLSYPTSWVNTDLSLYELIKRFVAQGICRKREPGDPNELFNDEFSRLLIRWLLNGMLQCFVPVAIVFTLCTRFSKDGRRAKKLIVGDRNIVAWQGIKEHLSTGNVATIWGAEHLFGISTYLKRAGFRETHRLWFTAYHIRSYSFWECFWAAWLDDEEEETAAT